MVLIERICYEVGAFVADVLIIGIAPTGVRRAYYVAKGFSCFAENHALRATTAEEVSNNLFECLPFME